MSARDEPRTRCAQSSWQSYRTARIASCASRASLMSARRHQREYSCSDRDFANVDFVVAEDRCVLLGKLLRVIERAHLDDREARDQLLRFGERSVEPHSFSADRLEAHRRLARLQ